MPWNHIRKPYTRPEPPSPGTSPGQALACPTCTGTTSSRSIFWNLLLQTPHGIRSNSSRPLLWTISSNSTALEPTSALEPTHCSRTISYRFVFSCRPVLESSPAGPCSVNHLQKTTHCTGTITHTGLELSGNLVTCTRYGDNRNQNKEERSP